MMPRFKSIEKRIGIFYMGVFYFTVLCLVPYQLSGQTKKVLITDHVHFHSDYSDSEIQFDVSQYFDNKEWTDLIRNQTVSLISNMFNQADVSYYNDAGFTYHYSGDDLNFKKINRDNADYFARISSGLDRAASQSYKSGGPNYTNYVLGIHVRIENAAGKKSFRKTLRLPFQVKRPNYLHDLSIDQEDFETMYSDVLNAVFTGQKRLKKRIVQNGRSESNANFTSESDRFTLMHDPKDQVWLGERYVNGTYELIDAKKQVLGSIKITGGSPQSEFTEAFGLNLSNRLKQTSELQNSISGEDFTIVSGLNTNLDYEFETPGSPFPRVVVVSAQDMVGKYEFLGREKFVGDLAGEKYMVILKNEVGLFELFHQDQLKGLIQLGSHVKEEKGKGKYINIVYLKKELTEKEQAKLLNLYFFMHMGNHIALMAAKEKEEKEED